MSAAAALPLQQSVSQYGITWAFDKPAPVGQFVNGDYYVVGAVTVADITPRPRYGTEVEPTELDGNEKNVRGGQYIRNGSMLNPPARKELAFDSGIRNWFRPQLASKLPIAMQPGDSLASSISLKLDEEAKGPYHSTGKRGEHDNAPVRVVAVLTCMDKEQPADAFRPSYCDPSNTVYLASNLRRERLPRLPKVKGAPRLEKFAEVFQKPWFDTGYFGFDRPMENMPHYGQWIGQSVSIAGLLLCMDYTEPEKEKLLINLVQAGIDYWGVVRGGHPGWEGWGGHGSGHKFPIVFAGFMLDDPAMMTPTRGFPKVEFGEDNQTRFGDCWTGAKVVFTGHSGISSATGEPPRPKWGPYEHLSPAQWKNEGDRKNYQSEAYRRANTSCCWVGQSLALHILKLEEAWNHDAFFAYVDRWMYEDDKEFRQDINKYFPDANLVNETKDWCHQGYACETWVKDFWNQRRTAPGMPPTDVWKTGGANR